MSSVPPSTPPGGMPPPYDPHTQWRIYREQQRAAWRAQRDAWKAQRYAMKAGYVGAYGPRVPSVVGPIILVGIGIVGLLMYSGRIAAASFLSLIHIFARKLAVLLHHLWISCEEYEPLHNTRKRGLVAA